MGVGSTVQTASPPAADVLEWARAFAAAVRRRDFDAGIRMCDRAVLGFGTRTVRASGLAALVGEQWKHIWPNTAGFDFDYDNCMASASGPLAWFASGWSSLATRVTPPIRRHGRATIVLRRDGASLLAVHTHFSLDPTDPLLGGSPPASRST